MEEMNFKELKRYCKTQVPFTAEELKLIDQYFETRVLEKKDFLLQDGKVCSFLGFVAKGTLRHFHIKDAVERTCDISFENSWVTDFQSFIHQTPCVMNIQALERSVIFVMSKEKLHKLYLESNKYETFGRLMAEQVAQRATAIAMSLSSEKPEERFQNFIQKQPNILQRVPQKYIANFLGISPESLSRIRNRIIQKSKS